jgi:hypothetical protein
VNSYAGAVCVIESIGLEKDSVGKRTLQYARTKASIGISESFNRQEKASVGKSESLLGKKKLQ